MKRLYGRVKSR